LPKPDTLRATDVVGRLGGEEFIAALPSSLSEAAIAAERVCVALAATNITRNGQRVGATVSIGVSCGPPTATVDGLITRADEALYRAKAGGRNRVETAGEIVSGIPEAVPQSHDAATPRKIRRKEKGTVTAGAPEGCIA
jgi:hypothetical protein